MTRLLRSSLLVAVVGGCGFHPADSTGDGSTTQSNIDAPASIALDAAITSDAKHFTDAPAMQPPPPPPKNCAEALAAGMTTDGTTMIDPDGMGGAPPYQVYCD